MASDAKIKAACKEMNKGMPARTNPEKAAKDAAISQCVGEVKPSTDLQICIDANDNSSGTPAQKAAKLTEQVRCLASEFQKIKDGKAAAEQKRIDDEQKAQADAAAKEAERKAAEEAEKATAKTPAEVVQKLLDEKPLKDSELQLIDQAVVDGMSEARKNRVKSKLEALGGSEAARILALMEPKKEEAKPEPRADKLSEVKNPPPAAPVKSNGAVVLEGWLTESVLQASHLMDAGKVTQADISALNQTQKYKIARLLDAAAEGPLVVTYPDEIKGVRSMLSEIPAAKKKEEAADNASADTTDSSFTIAGGAQWNILPKQSIWIKDNGTGFDKSSFQAFAPFSGAPGGWLDLGARMGRFAILGELSYSFTKYAIRPDNNYALDETVTPYWQNNFKLGPKFFYDIGKKQFATVRAVGSVVADYTYRFTGDDDDRRAKGLPLNGDWTVANGNEIPQHSAGVTFMLGAELQLGPFVLGCGVEYLKDIGYIAPNVDVGGGTQKSIEREGFDGFRGRCTLGVRK